VRSAALYICYYHIDEPLVQTQVVTYVRELAARGYDMHLLTFERTRPSRAQADHIRAELAAAGIRWHWLRYHKRPSLPATLYDIAAGTLAALVICLRYRICLVHARSHVPAAMASALRVLLGRTFLFDVRGLLADEYSDAGHWRKRGLKYALTKSLERTFFRRADAFVMLTARIKNELLVSEPALRGRANDIEVIPCCVDTRPYDSATRQRDSLRRQLGWEGRRVFCYLGKLGMWYLVDEMARFFRVAIEREPRSLFLVLTQSDASLMERSLVNAGVPRGAWTARSCPPAEVPALLSAADAGLSFVRTCYAKRSSSPTKVGEYLAAGLPVLSTPGIGDLDQMLSGPSLGVIVSSLDETGYRAAVDSVLQILADPATPARCREYAQTHLSLHNVGAPRYANLYARLIRGPAPTGLS
jgi:glycosyltransferase involved in cell wall biosynthesis